MLGKLFVVGPLIIPDARISKANEPAEICAAPVDGFGIGVGSIQTGGRDSSEGRLTRSVGKTGLGVEK